MITALVDVFNRGLLDYTTPIDMLLAALVRGAHARMHFLYGPPHSRTRMQHVTPCAPFDICKPLCVT